MPLVSPTPIRLLVPRAMSREAQRQGGLFRARWRRRWRRASAIGTLKVSRGDSVVLEVPLQAGEDVGSGSLHQRAFDAVGELVINVFRAGVERLMNVHGVAT